MDLIEMRISVIFGAAFLCGPTTKVTFKNAAVEINNPIQIDVDIGSSSVAKSIISLVLGYVTSLVVDLAILIEAKEEAELPEYILGTVRLNRVKPDTAVQLEV